MSLTLALPRIVSLSWLFVIAALPSIAAAELPPADKVQPVKLFEVDSYCEGVVFDHEGNGYISWGKVLTKFSLDGNHATFAETGGPNGHKILADGTHVACDATRHAMIRLSADGKLLEPASTECLGKPLKGPNDLTLDLVNGGFYFTDPGDSGKDNLVGTVHYVDKGGKTHLVAEGLAYPNGIAISLDGKRLLVAESQFNRILEYPIEAPGKVGLKRVFAELPRNASGKWEDNQPDGICQDAEGNLYVAHYGMNAVQVLSPAGKLLRTYKTGNQLTSNVAFGGPKHDQLFVTGSVNADGKPGAVVRLDLGVPGQKILPARGK